MKEKIYLKFILGIVLISFVAGAGFLFIENVELKKSIKQKEELENLIDNEYSSFFEQTPEDWKTYRNEKYGFEIGYPLEALGGKIREIHEGEYENTEIEKIESINGAKLIGGVSFNYIPIEPEKVYPIYFFNIAIFQGNLNVEFLNQYLLKYAYTSIEEKDINYWGEEIKKRDLSEKFWNQKIIHLNNQIPAYEIFFPAKPGPVISDSFEKAVFISFPQKNLIFVVKGLFYKSKLFSELVSKEEYLEMILFEKILSTFRFLK